MSAGGRGGSSPRVGAGRHGQHAPIDTNELDMVASLFSVSQRQSVAEITMRYSGETVDDALTKFAQKLAVVLPGASCSGWDWNGQVDPEHIRQIAE